MSSVDPLVSLPLSSEEAVELWWALYLTYGNDTKLWGTFRGAVGEARWASLVEAGSTYGRNNA